MFTGLITGIGTIRAITPIGNGQDARFTIQTPANEVWQNAEKRLGASIACSGVCLTVIAAGTDWFTVEVSAETLAKTILGGWKPGTKINLEGSLRLGDELGGHLVSGHVDGQAEIISTMPENASTRWVFELPQDLAPFVAPKGSIAINGVSLTVNEVDGPRFGVNIIPHTAEHTNFSTLRVGDKVNVEIDMLARYLARQLGFKTA
ncbi:riboflavin synthase [Acidocella sp.]|uniref:riboflavin synthase n=1 Tax=Acidocella sp. TaxID=50710 RepID=UPI003CFE567D